jgi:hypothetical protein
MLSVLALAFGIAGGWLCVSAAKDAVQAWGRK